MPFIGVQPATVPLTSSDITDGIVTTAKIADTAISTAKIADDAVTGAKIENTPSIANGLTLTDGNLVVASGHGIDFSANSSASGMTSELFDDYEVGTWTPVIKDNNSTVVTTTQVIAEYKKVGNLVTLEFTAQRNDSTNYTSALYITGLPFTTTNIPAVRGHLWVDNTSSDVKCFIYAGSSAIGAFCPKTGTNDNVLVTSNWGNNRYLYGSLTYLT